MKKKLLIVEDDTDLQRIFHAVLTKSGFDTEILADGRTLLERANYPDLFILDIELPHMNGLELCKKLKANPPTKDIPVLMMSANDGLRRMAKDVCADDALEKPFDIHVLVSRVKKLLSSSE